MSSAKLSASEAARLLGRGRALIAEAYREGVERNLPALVRWLEAKAAARACAPLERRVRELEGAAGAAPGSDTSEASEAAWRARKRAAEAGLRELELAERRGELLNRVDVRSTWETKITAAKLRLRALPKTAVTRLRLTREQGTGLAELIDELLRSLAGDGLPPKRRTRAPAYGGDAA